LATLTYTVLYCTVQEEVPLPEQEDQGQEPEQEQEPGREEDQGGEEQEQGGQEEHGRERTLQEQEQVPNIYYYFFI
jgi:hypothetical protein